MARNKNKPAVFDESLQYGKQTPDEVIEWHYESVAHKLGWTTAEGRALVQQEFDAEIRSIGLRLTDQNVLTFYTRRREFTPPEVIVDAAPAAEVPDITTDPGFPQGTPAVIDVSGTESREATDPSHIVVDGDGLLVGAITPLAPAAVIPAAEEPAAEQTQVNPVPDWATPAVAADATAVVPTADPTPLDTTATTVEAPAVSTTPPAAIPF